MQGYDIEITEFNYLLKEEKLSEISCYFYHPAYYYAL